MSTSSQSTDPLADLEHEHTPADFAARLHAAWERGWLPLDLARIVGTSNPLAAALLADAISADRADWHPQASAVFVDHAETIGASAERWWDVDEPYWPQFVARHRCRADAARSAAWMLAFLGRDLPTQPQFEPPPSQPGRTRASGAVDEGMLARVRALLAKAESTTFDEEAQALSAKAQELITRHSIDVALLADEVDVPGGRRLYLDRPYTQAKFVLLDTIAEANDCRCVWNNKRETATIIGHQTDLQLTEMLFTSLLLQGTAAVVAAGTQTDHFGRSTTKSWRNAFWYGFASRIGERLQEARRAARSDAVATTGETLLPVLAARSAAVEEAFEEAFPDLGTIDISLSNGQGLNAGRCAADSAELSAERSVHGKRRALRA